MRRISLARTPCFRGRSGPRRLLPSYFRAIRRWYQRSDVAGVTMLSSDFSAERSRTLAWAASRRRWSSEKRGRFPPSSSRCTRFSTMG